jgi:Family of unknown function (DUF6011)
MQAMNTFTKIGDDWGVKVQSAVCNPGDVVVVTTRSGKRKSLTLGQFVFTDSYGNRVFHVAPAVRREAETVGDLSAIIAMFATARQHLKYPAIVLDGFRVSVAGPRAREPGSLTITSAARDQHSRFGGGMQRSYYGRVTLAGVYEPGRDAPDGLGEKLRAFAADPVGVAAAYGHLHGACCFCTRPLSDERSTAVGYGPICADHFGLAWGARPAPVLQCDAA